MSLEILQKQIHAYFDYLATYGCGDIFFAERLTYSPTDIWASDADWQSVAIQALEKYANDSWWALEILLKLNVNTKEILPKAVNVIDEWQADGGFDYHYYMYLLAVLPKNHPIRKRFFGESQFESILQDRISLDAIIYAEDYEFFEFVSKYIDRKIFKKDIDIEKEILPIVYRLENRASQILSHKSQVILQDFIANYFKKDEIMVNRYLNGEQIKLDEERLIWIADDIGKAVWCLNFTEMLEQVKKADWYWCVLFSDYLPDYEAQELLAWSAIIVNPLLHQEAEIRDMKGVIAKTRLLQLERKFYQNLIHRNSKHIRRTLT